MSPEERREQDRFERELWEEAIEFHEAVKRGLVIIVEDLLTRILRRSPFKTGYLLANWQTGEKAATRSRVKFRGRTKRASITRQGAVSVAVAGFRQWAESLQDPYQEIRIINTADYASFVHEKDGGASLEDLVALSVQEVNAKTYEIEVR
jgi:hypothetical protein